VCWYGLGRWFLAVYAFITLLASPGAQRPCAALPPSKLHLAAAGAGPRTQREIFAGTYYRQQHELAHTHAHTQALTQTRTNLAAPLLPRKEREALRSEIELEEAKVQRVRSGRGRDKSHAFHVVHLVGAVREPETLRPPPDSPLALRWALAREARVKRVGVRDPCCAGFSA
jgi:hypothetical protein